MSIVLFIEIDKITKWAPIKIIWEIGYRYYF